MRIQMELDRGYLPDAYGKYAAPEDCYDWSCRRSFPFTVEDVPYGTRALAVFSSTGTAYPYVASHGFTGVPT